MKKLFTVTALVACALFLVQANAMALPVQFVVSDIYDWGRDYQYVPAGGGDDPSTTGFNENEAHYVTINTNPYSPTTPVAGTKFYADTFGIHDNFEDSWGIGQVEKITELGNSTNVIWDRATSGEELTFFFWGFDDNSLGSPSGSGVAEILAVGGHGELWLSSTQNFNPNLGTGGRSNPGDPSFYQTATDEGTLVMDLTPHVMYDGITTFSNSFNFGTDTGNGTVYWDVTGGTWQDAYDTNLEGFGSDLYFSFTSSSNDNPVTGDWVVRGAGFAEGTMVPEPASMGLIGMGLLSMLGIIKRRK